MIVDSESEEVNERPANWRESDAVRSMDNTACSLRCQSLKIVSSIFKWFMKLCYCGVRILKF